MENILSRFSRNIIRYFVVPFGLRIVLSEHFKLTALASFLSTSWTEVAVVAKRNCDRKSKFQTNFDFPLVISSSLANFPAPKFLLSGNNIQFIQLRMRCLAIVMFQSCQDREISSILAKIGKWRQPTSQIEISWSAMCNL